MIIAKVMKLNRTLLLSGLLLLTCNTIFSQSKLNFGLSQPQDPATLPKSAVKPQTPVRKAKTVVPEIIRKVSENEYLLSSG
jgi:hypothetical protein